MSTANSNLARAKAAKNDEHYTRYYDIEREVNSYLEVNEDLFRGKTVLLPCDDPKSSNFTRYFSDMFSVLGLKKLISTSYGGITGKKGNVFILESDANGDGRIDIEDLECRNLEGDGDFRSDEVKRFRDEADMIITNPPFSLFREFIFWIMEAGKEFLVIGNSNAITYKEIFPRIKGNTMWLGVHPVKEFIQPDGSVKTFGNICWFTNVDHGDRNTPIPLMSAKDNLRFSRHEEVRGAGYRKYDNYEAIEVPYVDSIPEDYEGVMGVPISYLSRHCPGQFEIVGADEAEGTGFSSGLFTGGDNKQCMVNGKKVYKRIFIRKSNLQGEGQ